MADSRKISLVEAPYILYRCMRDPDTPRYLKLLIGLLLAYLLSPLDLIPDIIPVLGLLDEAIIMPLLLKKIPSLLPDGKLLQYRKDHREVTNKKMELLGITMVIGTWILLLMLLNLSWQIL